MTPRELTKLTVFWKRVLSLGDWSIKSRFVSSRKHTGDAAAAIFFQESTKDAHIFILRYLQRTGRLGQITKDYEVDLVHEMLHLHTDMHWETKGREDYMAKEKFIEAQARALVALKRGDPYLFHPKEE